MPARRLNAYGALNNVYIERRMGIFPPIDDYWVINKTYYPVDVRGIREYFHLGQFGWDDEWSRHLDAYPKSDCAFRLGPERYFPADATHTFEFRILSAIVLKPDQPAPKPKPTPPPPSPPPPRPTPSPPGRPAPAPVPPPPPVVTGPNITQELDGTFRWDGDVLVWTRVRNGVTFATRNPLIEPHRKSVAQLIAAGVTGAAKAGKSLRYIDGFQVTVVGPVMPGFRNHRFFIKNPVPPKTSRPPNPNPPKLPVPGNGPIRKPTMR